MANTTRSNYIPGMIDCERAILDSVFDKNSMFFPLYRKQIEKKRKKTGENLRRNQGKAQIPTVAIAIARKKDPIVTRKKTHIYCSIILFGYHLLHPPPLLE
jgi:hypothetical protein